MNDINLLNPKFKQMAQDFLDLCKFSGLNVKITQTLRTEEEQIALYASGRQPLAEVNRLRAIAKLPAITEAENKWRTNARTVANSFHGYGLAFDIAVFDPSGKKIDWSDKADWDKDGISDWIEAGKLAMQIPGLEWGGNWTSCPDIPHYQCSFGLTLADLKAGKRP